MTDFKRSRELSSRIESLKKIWGICLNSYIYAIDRQTDNVLDEDEIKKSIEVVFPFLDSDIQEEIMEKVKNDIKEINKADIPFLSYYDILKPNLDEFKDRINEFLKVLVSELDNIPNSIKKTKGELLGRLDLGIFEYAEDFEAACLLKDKLPEQIVNKEIVFWKKQIQENNENQGIFWVSGDDRYHSDIIARYRFLEKFNIGEFPDIQDEIETIFRSDIFCEPDDKNLWLLIHRLWEISRSKELSSKLRYSIDNALKCLCNNQKQEGWWCFHEPPFEPNIYLTAMCCNILLKLSRSNNQKEQAKKGIQWLVNKQSTDGYWRDIDKFEKEEKPEIFTTLLVLESIKLSKVDGLKRTIDLGDNWLKTHLYISRGPNLFLGISRMFIRILLVEYFESDFSLHLESFKYLPMVKIFIEHSWTLLEKENDEYNKMAIVLTFNALEMFLYECLSFPSINISIYSGSNTIGMKEALNKFQNYLQNNKIDKQKYLNKGQQIENKNQLLSLKNKRNEIVHQGSSVAKSQVINLISYTIQFINLYSDRIFGFEIF